MIIFITGSDGLIGKELAKKFKNHKNIELILHTRKKKNKRKNLYFSKDLKKKIYLEKIPDIIIHCASINKSFDETDKKKKKFIKNIEMVKNIINYANINKVKKIIFFSSIDIYGKITKKIVNENNKPNSVNYYGKSKLICERLMKKNSNLFRSICLRIPGVLTLDLSNNRTFLGNIIKKLICKKKITIFNEDKKFNNLIDVQELFKVLKLLINKKLYNNKIYNLSANSPISILQIIKKIQNIFLISSYICIRSKKQKSFIINNKKIQKDLKIDLATTSEIINRFCKEIKNKKNKLNV
jgi:nucleoside-diphosphate-sugar epimerase